MKLWISVCTASAHAHYSGLQAEDQKQKYNWRGLTFRDGNPNVKNIVLVGGVPSYQAS